MRPYPWWLLIGSSACYSSTSARRQRFDAPQKQLIQTLANYAAIAIDNAERFRQKAERRVRELVRLQEIDRRISSTLEMQEVLDLILQAATEEIPADEASILLLDANARSCAPQRPMGVVWIRAWVKLSS